MGYFDRKTIRTFPHTATVFSLAFSPDGRLLATGEGKELNDNETNVARLWDMETGNNIVLAGHEGYVFSVAFSPDGKTLVTCSAADKKIRMWDAQTGKLNKILEGQTDEIYSVAFSPDGKMLGSGGQEGSVNFWNLVTGERTSVTGHASMVYAVAFSRDGTLASGGGDGLLKLWKPRASTPIRTFSKHNSFVRAVAFSADGQTLVSASSDQSIKLWNVSDGSLKDTIAGHSTHILSVTFSKDGTMLASANFDDTVKLWNLKTGKLERSLDYPKSMPPLPPNVKDITAIAFSPDGKILASGDNTKIKLWNTATGDQIAILTGHTHWINSLDFSPDGNILASGSQDGKIKLWNVKTGKAIRSLELHTKAVKSVVFSPDGAQLASGSADGSIRLWNVETGEPINSFPGHTDEVSSVAFSPGGEMLASGSFDKTIRLWDPKTGREKKIITGRFNKINSISFSTDGKTLVSGDIDGAVTIVDVETGNQRKLKGHEKEVKRVAYSPTKDIFATSSWDASVKLWTPDRELPLATLIALDKDDWAVVTPESSFDASDRGKELTHFVIPDAQMNFEVIYFKQLEDRYFEPHLLAKLIGFDKEDPLRRVKAFQNVKLYPTAELIPPGPGGTKAILRVSNRGGGIGKIEVYINDSLKDEAIPRGSRPGPDQQKFEQEIDLEAFRRFMIPGEKNRVMVKTYNGEGYLSSRGVEIVYTPAKAGAAGPPPAIWAVFVGVSDYKEGGNLSDLKYAAKDADSMAQAFKAVSQELFPNTHIRVLSTASRTPEEQPSKANIERILREFADQEKGARVDDILILYFAGHGVSFLKSDTTDDFYFLTRDANTGNMSDAAIRAATALSGEELTNLISKIPAKKQIVILDTCASGKFAAEAADIRGVDSSTERAWNKMKDRQGLWILAGSTGDAVSYESNRYAQGVLTYSLLQGMYKDFDKVTDKADNNKFELLDVSKLFQYSRDTVPDLAKGIRGIQTPKISNRKDASSFHIGRLNEKSLPLIPYTKEKPVYLSSDFTLLSDPEDPLGLTDLMNQKLNMETARGAEAKLVFWETMPKFAGAFKIRGRYEVIDRQVKATIHLYTFAGDNLNFVKVAAPFIVAGEKGDLDKLLSDILAEVEKRIPAPPKP